LAPLAQREGTRNSYHLYVVRLLQRPGEGLPDVARDRLRLYEHLVANDIRPQVHYIPVPREPYYRETFGTDPAEFPGALAYYAGCLSLPIFPAMADEDVDRVVNVVAGWVTSL
jgi:dTDP-4-amino-4,6-dideoxygalactose transaminase